MQDNVKVVINFFKEQFLIVDFIIVKALDYMQTKELA